MHTKLFAVAALAALLGSAVPAAADTLYVAAPPPKSPGHPLSLGPDHRAQQVGDLLQVVFNFAVNSTSTDVSSNNNQYQLAAVPGTGLAASVGIIKTGLGLNGSRAAQNSRTQSGSNTFTSTMEATVTDVLPSGALAIAGDQRLIVNGQQQMLHITGIVRPEDIDSADSVLSTRVANVKAEFSGNFQEKRKGLIQRVLDFLF